MNIKEKFIYENGRGQNIEFSISSPFFITSVSGIDGLKNMIYTYKGIMQDGSNYLGSTLESRYITLEGAIRTDKELNRSKLISILNPKLDGKLTYINDGIMKYVACNIEQAPLITKEIIPKFLIQIVCPNPFWKDTFINGDEISTLIGGKTWPFRFPVTFSTRGEPVKNIINNGDVETPVQVIFKGPAINPKITNKSTGEFIKVKRTLNSGDTLLINTEFGNKKVEIQRANSITENAFNYISLDSTFFQLQVGDNIIEYSTENELDPQSVMVKFTSRYLGI